MSLPQLQVRGKKKREKESRVPASASSPVKRRTMRRVARG
jgi:hypothetical protein